VAFAVCLGVTAGVSAEPNPTATHATPAAAGGRSSGTGATPKIAYVIPISASPGSHDLYGAALLGFERAAKDFHVDAHVVQLAPTQETAVTLTLLARQRYDLIIVGIVRGPEDIDTVVAFARRFPATRFVVTDPLFLRRTWPSNVQGAIWHVEQPAYLAGYLAGLMERRRPGKDVVGSVGGGPQANVNTFIAGFEAGAKAADPGITILRSYSFDFLAPRKCRAVALAQIARGAGALFDVAGLCGVGTLQAAKTNNVWGIGVDVDQSFLGPHILTSVLKRFDVQVYDTVQAFVRGKLRTGGNAVWDLHNGGVGLGTISPKVPRALLADLDHVRQQIAAGRISVPTAPAQK
jgi:basic membrane protein A